MDHPLQVLGLTPEATPEAIRAKYLQLVRENPPDRAPERFAAIRAAYESLSDPVNDLVERLFRFKNTDSISAIRRDLRQQLRSARLTVEALLSLADVT